ncbi:MAG: hypothetical protein AAFQ94_22820 [Bacteroidota bacterium]
MNEKAPGICEMCEKYKKLTFHHLIPRKCHTNKWFKKQFDKEDMKTRGINICRTCHNYIHEIFSQKELGRNYNTLELLMEHEKIAKFVEYSKRRK